MSENPPSVDKSINEVPRMPGKPAKWHRRLLFPACAALFGIGIFLWALLAYDSMLGLNQYGLAPRNVILLAAPGFSLLVMSIWFYFLSVFSWKTKLGVFVLSLIPITAGFASVKRVDFDGDMGMIPRWRWEKSTIERLAEHKAGLEKVEVPQPGSDINVRPEDMANFRGKDFAGIVTGPTLDISISKDNPPAALWQAPIGEGYAQFSIVGNYAVTMEQRGSDEMVTCYEIKSGREIWTYATNTLFFEAMGGTGPRSTPTIHQGRVYTLGARGHAACLELTTGKKIWSKELLMLDGKQLGVVTWGLSSSPLVLEDRVIFNPGAPDGIGLVACKLEDGEFIWQGEGYKAYPQDPHKENRCGYSTPFMAEIAGVKQLVHFHGKGLSGINADDGKVLWSFPFENGAGVNVCQPIILPDDQILISASYGKGSALVKVSKNDATWKAEAVWENPNTMRAKFSNSILHDGYVYGLDEGMLTCIDPLKGEETWKKKSRDRKYGHGQLLLAGNHLLVLAEDGNLAFVEANPNEFKEVWKFSALKEFPPKRVWNPPALVDGVVYLRDHTEMAAYDLRENKNPESQNKTENGNSEQQK